VKDRMGYGLFVAQRGGKHAGAKPLKGYGGAGVVEIVRDHSGDTFRAVYAVRLAGPYTCCTPSKRSRRQGAKRRRSKSC
jgi:phage-related protein